MTSPPRNDCARANGTRDNGSTSSIAFVSGEPDQGLNDHRIFQLAKLALEDVMVGRLLTKHLLEPHLALTQRAGRIHNLRHDSSLSANAEPIGVCCCGGGGGITRSTKTGAAGDGTLFFGNVGTGEFHNRWNRLQPRPMLWASLPVAVSPVNSHSKSQQSFLLFQTLYSRHALLS